MRKDLLKRGKQLQQKQQKKGKRNKDPHIQKIDLKERMTIL
jgi:hypothetical protein